jgi:hypothetical protein
MIYTNLGQNLQIKKAQLRVSVLRTLSLTLGECLPTLGCYAAGMIAGSLANVIPGICTAA